MSNEKLLRANVTILAAYPEAFVDPTHPKAAELNDWFVYSTHETGKVKNISCAILDDYTLNMTDPDTDDSLSICDIGNVSTPTFDKYEVSLDGFRDKSLTDNGVFNLFYEAFAGADRPYWIIKRIGKPSTAIFLTDGSDVISMFGVNTDYPVDLVEDNTMLKSGARFKNTGDLNINYSVVA